MTKQAWGAGLLIATVVGIAGCTGPTASSGARDTTEPPAGVPATATGPLPLPVLGERYDNPQPRSDVEHGGTVTLPLSSLGPNFNFFSADGASGSTNLVLSYVAPRLWDLSVDGKPTPNEDYLISATLIDKEPQTVRYVLNPEAAWNNGDPITWEAFHTTWLTQSGNSDKYNPSSTQGYSQIESVRQGENPKEAIVTFAEPYYPYESLFNQIEHPMNQDPTFYKEGWVNDLHPELGAGPFTVAELSETRLVLERNPKWWGEPAKLDQIIFEELESNAAVNAFVNGEIDAVNIDTANALKQVQGMADTTIRIGQGLSVHVHYLSRHGEFLRDPQARKAVILATNRKLMAKIQLQGLNWREPVPGSQIMYPFQDGYRDNMKDLRFDPAEAKKVLDDAGWKVGADGYRSKDGAKATVRFVYFSKDASASAMARAQQQQLKDIGVKMEIVNKSNAADITKIANGRSWDMMVGGISFVRPFAYAQWACAFYCTDGGINYAGMGTAALDKKFRAVSTIPDPARAKRAFNAAESTALHQYGVMPLFNGPSITATKAKLANYGPSGYLTVPPQNLGWEK